MCNFLIQTPLHLAVITRQPRIVRKLIDRGASVDLQDRNGQTCLHLACQREDIKTIKAIFSPRPDKPEIHEKLQEVLEIKNFEGKAKLLYYKWTFIKLPDLIKLFCIVHVI